MNIVIGWPQAVYLALACIGFGFECARHGQQKTAKHNAWGAIIALLVVLFVLYSGGFFAGVSP